MTPNRQSLRFLFINPRATYAGEIAQKCYPPLNLLYMARVLADRGFTVDVLDANALRMGDQRVAAEAVRFGPDLIGVPLYTEVMAPVYRMIRRLKRRLPGARFVVGGPHASALPERVLTDFPDVDFVMRGESERSIAQLCEALCSGDGLETVRNLTRREGDRIANNPDEPPIDDLDTLRPPARELVADVYDRKLYYTLLVRDRPVDTLVTSRGCPFSCNFCYNHSHRYRSRSTDDVMDEILSIHRRGIRDIEILDDTFTLRRERAMALFRALIAEKLPMSLRIKSRVDVVDPEFVRTARRAGVYMISYGMESGDDEMLRRMNKRTTAEQNAAACRITREAGVACHSGWVIGYPGETPESIERTVRFIISIKPTTCQLALLRPYPQTAVYLQAQQEGTLVGDWSVHSDDYPWVKLPWTETREDLQRCLHRAVRKIYYRPHYVWQFGAMIVAGANVTLARYALQETGKSLRHLLGLRRSERVGSV